MISVLSAIVLVLTGLAIAVTAIYAFEVLSGCFALHFGDRQTSAMPFAGRIAVLIPAHNEQGGIRPTLEDIKSQLKTGDRLLVIADNCTDQTAAVAAAAGAEVTVRNDPSLRGKGYALAWGLDHLASDPPDVVLIIDADCRIESGTLSDLASLSAALNRPVQSLYTMTASARSGISQQVSAFAWRVKNHLRPLGLKALNLPCQLMGTGMAFPWDVIRSVNLSNGHIVEDLKLGIDLTYLGYAPCFHPEVVISSTFPTSTVGELAQRQRWEHGHVSLIVDSALPSLWSGVLRRNLKQIAISLDLLVPPLSLLSLMIVGLLITTGWIAAAGISVAGLVLSIISATILLIATLLAWLVVGRDALPARSLLQIPFYIGRKIPLYLRLIVGRGVSSWIRSDRA